MGPRAGLHYTDKNNFLSCQEDRFLSRPTYDIVTKLTGSFGPKCKHVVCVHTLHIFTKLTGSFGPKCKHVVCVHTLHIGTQAFG
jgi:hypothetical protein